MLSSGKRFGCRECIRPILQLLACCGVMLSNCSMLIYREGLSCVLLSCVLVMGEESVDSISLLDKRYSTF